MTALGQPLITLKRCTGSCWISSPASIRVDHLKEHQRLITGTTAFEMPAPPIVGSLDRNKLGSNRIYSADVVVTWQQRH